MVITKHAIDRFRQRFDPNVTEREARDLLRLAWRESRPLPKRLRRLYDFVLNRKYQEARFLYHHHSGLVLVLGRCRETNQFRFLISCWVER